MTKYRTNITVETDEPFDQSPLRDLVPMGAVIVDRSPSVRVQRRHTHVIEVSYLEMANSASSTLSGEGLKNLVWSRVTGHLLGGIGREVEVKLISSKVDP